MKTESTNVSKNKTYWKKNNDSRYISGEDLEYGESMGKGLKSQMVVSIISFEDKETFDQNNQEKIIKTGLHLMDLETKKPLYKPVILNNTNGDFLEKELESYFLEDWLNKPVILYAKADRRHGHVARFRKYHTPAKPTLNDERFQKALKGIEEKTVKKSDLDKYKLTEAQIKTLSDVK